MGYQSAVLPLLVGVATLGGSQWTRTQNGQVVDLFDLTPKGDGLLIVLREGPGKPVYSSGFCVWAGGQIGCVVRNATNGQLGLVLLTPGGGSTHYRSWFGDGRMSWDGDFALAQGTLETAGRSAPETPAAGPGPSLWTRSRNGAVIDQFQLLPHGEGATIALREGPDKPVYSSGFCVPAGGRTVCGVRGTGNGRTGLILLTTRGNIAQYRSWFDDGTLSWDGAFTLSGGGAVSTTAAPPVGVRYRVENFVAGSPDKYVNPRNYHDFVVDFATCKVRGLNPLAEAGKETIQVAVCRARERLTFTVTQPQTTVEYDWVFRDNGRTISGAYRQGTTFGPSVGGVVNP